MPYRDARIIFLSRHGVGKATLSGNGQAAHLSIGGLVKPRTLRQKARGSFFAKGEAGKINSLKGVDQVGISPCLTPISASI